MEDWLSVTIEVEEEGKEHEGIFYGAKKILPRIGEYIWMPYEWERLAEFRTRSFLVTDIAHHMPTKPQRFAYDSIVIYVEPVRPDETTERRLNRRKDKAVADSVG